MILSNEKIIMKFSKKFSLVTILILCVFVFKSIAQIPVGYEKGLEYIDKKDIKNSITYLASDELKGRATGSEENLEAARYIAKKFYDFGLQPYVENKSYVHVVAENDDEEDGIPLQPKQNVKIDFYDKYFQKFYLTSSTLSENKCGLTLTKRNSVGQISFPYKVKKDFIISYKSQKGISLNAPLVFIGYGINSGENNYNDYLDDNGKEIDVKNKIVLLVDSYPNEDDLNSDFSKSKNIVYKNVRKKSEIAMEKGAIAVLVVQSPLKQNPPFIVKFENMSSAFLKRDFGLPELKTKESIPLVYISNEVVRDLFAGTNETLSGLLTKINNDLRSVAFEVAGTTVNLEIDFDVDFIPTQNIIGFIEGTDPILKNEFVVFGAHYDHVGLGYYGAMDKKNVGQIHNGADDNASGTSGLIELAEAFSKCKPKRSLIFAAFSGEENGILGSRYYTSQNPFKKIENTVAMVNLDMIGRNEPELIWVGGIFYSEDLKKIVKNANSQIGFELLYNVGLLNFGSDQGPFIRKQIPSLFFFSGLHDDYHTPNDDTDKINFDKAEQVSKLAYLSGWILANQEEKPQYREATMDEKIVLVKESLERQKKYRPEGKKIN